MRPFDHSIALGIAGAGLLCLVWLPAPWRWGAGAAMGVLALLWLAARGHWRGGVVARLKGFTWDRQTFCQHFLITGATGSGKTLSGILPLLFQLFKHQPRFGGLCVDMKGVLHEAGVEMARASSDWRGMPDKSKPPGSGPARRSARRRSCGCVTTFIRRQVND